MIIQGFKGIHNTVPPRSIPDNALVAAVDIDIDDAGVLLRRAGFSKVKNYPLISSAYSTREQIGYVVNDGSLYRLDDLLNQTLITDKSGAAIQTTATEFADYSKVLFTQDGFRVNEDYALSIKIPTPIIPIDISYDAPDMSIETGFISVCYCYRSLVSGLMGGSSPVAAIGINEGQSFDIIQPIEPDGYAAVIFKTDFGGSVYYSASGSKLPSAHLLANSFPDDVEKIEFHKGSLWLSKSMENGSSIVWFSKPGYYHLYDYLRNYIIVPGQVRGLQSVGGQLLIGTDVAVYAYGDSLQQLSDYGVPQGRPFSLLPDGNVLIFTHRGICRALPFENLTESKTYIDVGTTCSTSFMVDNNGKRFIVLNNSPQEYRR